MRTLLLVSKALTATISTPTRCTRISSPRSTEVESPPATSLTTGETPTSWIVVISLEFTWFAQ
ncbi:MAG: hypothetical protein RMJ98_09695 [Myxococcales bacterium]|nr:hypothetical protein [Polyangiaceae bacterium]MDW8249561.1 hypothetical protein [Myxococcales bacterium]